MEMLLQTFVNGVMVSLGIILIAAGLCLVFGILEIINFAHGEFYMLGGFGVWWFFDQHPLPIAGSPALQYILAIILTVILVGILGVLVERFIFRKIHENHTNTIIAALGIVFILQASALVTFGSRDKAVASPFSGMISLGGISLSEERIAAIICAVVFILGLYYLVQWTRMGKALRAVAQDHEAAQVMGVNIGHIFSVTMFVSCGLAAAGGALMGPIFYVNPYMGAEPVMKAFVVVILGGMGSLPGAVIGGFIIGMTESFVTTYVGAHLAMIVVFLILIGVLLVKPTGILGRGE
ncbi:MAG: branched-chain amino acid ABC transporter permease [Proteobacteria bacterium]|nr:branched-chain amino acid ABC transporter permease [Pseudomonadota bacterium]